MLLREIFIGGARAPPAPPHATALVIKEEEFKVSALLSILGTGTDPSLGNR